MGFQPIVPFGGMAGWNFLQSTLAAQKAAFNNTPTLQRDTEYFTEKISEVRTPEELVGDYRLLKVALGAFGLDDDLPNKAFIKKVLKEGSLDRESFANRMVDKRYLALAETFGFDLGTPNTVLSDFPEKITEKFKTRQFEIAVGEQNNSMRMALSLKRDLGDIATKNTTDDGKWFSVMGNQPLRQVFETALGLPSSLANLDIDKQLEIFRDKTETVFGNGDIEQFLGADAMEELNRLYLVRSQIQTALPSLSRGYVALALLRN